MELETVEEVTFLFGKKSTKIREIDIGHPENLINFVVNSRWSSRRGQEIYGHCVNFFVRYFFSLYMLHCYLQSVCSIFLSFSLINKYKFGVVRVKGSFVHKLLVHTFHQEVTRIDHTRFVRKLIVELIVVVSKWRQLLEVKGEPSRWYSVPETWGVLAQRVWAARFRFYLKCHRQWCKVSLVILRNAYIIFIVLLREFVPLARLATGFPWPSRKWRVTKKCIMFTYKLGMDTRWARSS